MILDILNLVAGTITFALAKAFGVINFAIPDNVETSITYFIGFLGYANGIFPVDTLLQALGTLFLFEFAWYSLKLILFVFALTPWFGKKSSPRL